MTQLIPDKAHSKAFSCCRLACSLATQNHVAQQLSANLNYNKNQEVSRDNKIYVRGAKARWKVENECFNTLKNQGYNLSHNYGHGEKNLSFNFYLLTVMAFTLHQMAELCDMAFQKCRKKAGIKRSLWEKLRTLVCLFIFETMEQLLRFYLKADDYNIIDGYVLSVPPPSG